MEKEDIISYYRKYNEDVRLKSAYGILEEEHTRRMILKHIPHQSSEIFDIGGGTGHYARWLADLGFRVHYSDIVPDHVRLFEERHGRQEGILSSSVQDARDLAYADCCADLIILNGPLYHLTKKEERLQALQESKRILNEGGQLLAFTIGRFAGLQYALNSGMIFDEDYYDMVVGELATGMRRNRSPDLPTFDTAYFHTDKEIESEMKEAGFHILSTSGVLGPAWMTPNLETDVLEADKRERLLAVSEIMEKYPILSPKMMTIGIKQDQ